MRPQMKTADPLALTLNGRGRVRRHDDTTQKLAHASQPLHLWNEDGGEIPYSDVAALGYTHILINAEPLSVCKAKTAQCRAAKLDVLASFPLPELCDKAACKACRHKLKLFLKQCPVDGFVMLCTGWKPLSPISYRLLRELVADVKRRHPQTLLIVRGLDGFSAATASQAFGGLGFDLKWIDEWTRDIQTYLIKEPRYRRYHHDLLTYSLRSAHRERYLLSLPSSWDKQENDTTYPFGVSDEWQREATIRTLYGYLIAHSGKKCSAAAGVSSQSQTYLARLNELYLASPALHEDGKDGLWVISPNDIDNSVIAFLRMSHEKDMLLCVLNFSISFHPIYRLGLPYEGRIEELLNSDRTEFGGGNQFNAYDIHARLGSCNGFPCWAEVCVPPLSCVLYTYQPFDTGGNTTVEGGRQ